MNETDALLAIFLLAGLGAVVAGFLLRRRKVRAEHWLWKRRRLLRARMLVMGGGTVQMLSAVAIVAT